MSKRVRIALSQSVFKAFEETVMDAAGETMFDPSLKKKKKKTVAFTVDPLGADADPTTPAPLDDLEGPTVHEQIAMSGRSGSSDEPAESTDDLNVMFGDVKKKQKKKLIPMDFVCPMHSVPLTKRSCIPQGDEGSGASTPANGTETPDLTDFSGLKKKKKKNLALDLGEDSGASTPVAKEGEDGATPADGAIPADDLNFLSGIKKKKKKKAFEDFERELGEAQGEDIDGAHLDNLDEAELGEDVFASGGGEVRTAAANEEPWLGSDRDYTYPEVSMTWLDDRCGTITNLMTPAPSPILRSTARTKPRSSFGHQQEILYCATSDLP